MVSATEDSILQLLEASEEVGAQAATSEEGNSEAGPTTTKVKRLPKRKAYHLIYDAVGKVVDWHEDFWRMDANGLLRKLARRVPVDGPGGGKPIWVLKLPKEASRPSADIPCSHPRCTVMFRTAEDKELHLRRHHPDFFVMERDKTEREARESQMAFLTKVLEQQNQQIAALTRLVKKEV